MPYTNPGFETPAAGNDGLADAWSILVSVTTDEIAGYNALGGAEDAIEAFEKNWSSNEDYLFAFESGDIGAAVYDTFPLSESVEDFNEEWSNESYATDLTSSSPAQYDNTPEGFEDFEENWDNDSYITSFSVTVSVSDTFETNWANNSYITAFTTELSAAAYDVAPENYEDFEENWTDMLGTP